MGVEPTSSVWKTDILTVVRYLHIWLIFNVVQPTTNRQKRIKRYDCHVAGGVEGIRTLATDKPSYFLSREASYSLLSTTPYNAIYKLNG